MFVSNECQDAIPPPFQTMWTLGQERADYKFSFMDDDELASQGVVEAALEGIARSCVAPPSSSSFYFTFHRYAEPALHRVNSDASSSRLRLLRRMLSAAVRSRERVRTSLSEALRHLRSGTDRVHS